MPRTSIIPASTTTPRTSITRTSITRTPLPRLRSAPARLSLSSQRAVLKRSRSGRVVVSGVVSLAGKGRAVDHAVARALQPFTLTALRMLLGLLFVWFGALKVLGDSPVAALVSQTLPFANQHLVMLGLGTAEVVLGILLMTGAFVRVALPALVMHLAGTFSTFVMAPGLMFSDGNPLLLTADGEFVVKNVVLIAATLVLIAHTSQTSASPSPAMATQLPVTLFPATHEPAECPSESALLSTKGWTGAAE